MISHEALEQLVAEMRRELDMKDDANRPLIVYLCGMIAGASLSRDGNPHTIATILEHIELDFKKLLREKP